ncbi:Serine protease 55, partial [Armadillidium vulgare]
MVSKNTCEVGVSSGAPSRVSLMDWESCKRFFENLGHGERLSRNEECLTAPSEHFVPFNYCTGLTGSPLTCHGRDGERVLSGILSLGWTCMHPNSPAIFTKISRYHEWITSVISSNGGTTRNFQCSKPTGNRFVKEVKGRDSDYRLDVFIPRTKGNEERVP